DRGRPDLFLPELPLEVLHEPVDRVGDRLLEVDRVEQVGSALEVESESHGLLPRPPGRAGPHQRRHQEHDRRDRQRHEQHDAIGDRSTHDFSRSFSRVSATGDFWTLWIALRSTWTCTLGAISTATTFSPTFITRPWIPDAITI